MTERSRTIAIVGAGFSGAALAYRLLRQASGMPIRIFLIESSNRFGCGLAYSERARGTTLNVPASRMSIDESQPEDLLAYLRSRELSAKPEEFIPRPLYGDYVETRLKEAELAASPCTQVNRVSRTVTSVKRVGAMPFWNVELDDGISVLADAVVLATGHCPPRPIAPLVALAGTGLYRNDPWSPLDALPCGARVLLIGTGLTMADVACKLARSAHPPREIVAISRRGLVPRTRYDAPPYAPTLEIGLERLERAGTLRAMIKEARAVVQRAVTLGINWRHVMVALRERAPALWHQLNDVEKARFLRHLQPYWDIHRHQLPPLAGKTLAELIRTRSLTVRAGRITGARLTEGRAEVTLLPRGEAGVEVHSFDLAINCSGSDEDPRRAKSPLVRTLLVEGLAQPDTTGIGFKVDATGSLIDRSGGPSHGLYYLGPWLRGRDMECSAVHELRQQATALAARLVSAIPMTLDMSTVAAQSAVRNSPARRNTRTVCAAATVK